MQTILMEDCPKCGTDLTPYATLPKPPAFCLQCKFPLMLIAGKYQLESVLGEGGFGTVYLAKHVRLTRNAERVVKLIKPEIFQYEGMDKRFFREVQVTSDLSQRNEHIVRIYDDFGEQPHLGHFYVMEYLQGLSLLDYINRRGFLPELGWSLAIFKQLCDAIQPAHEEEIIHRDLKPENILLIQRRNHPYFVKVLDFGIAKPMSSVGETKLTQGALGTPYYMSPEQTVNRPVDARSDIYSMGIMLYEMLTGEHPFIPQERENMVSAMELMSAHMTQQVPNCCERHPARGIPAGVGLAIQKAAAKEPAERFQSVELFWKAIDAAAGPLARVKPKDLPALLPEELRQRPSEQIRAVSTDGFAKTIGPEELEPGALQQEASPRVTPHASIASRSRLDAETRDSSPVSGPSAAPARPKGKGSVPMATGMIVTGGRKYNPLILGLLFGLLLGGIAVGVFVAKKWRPQPPKPRLVAKAPTERRGDANVLGLPPETRRDEPVARAVIPAPNPATPDARPAIRVDVRPQPVFRREEPVARRPKKRRRWRKRRAAPPKRVAANPDACPKAGWIRLKIRPCSNGRGPVEVQSRGLPGGKHKTKDICVPANARISIDQSRCSACIFRAGASPTLRQIHLKNTDEVDFDTGTACLKP